MYRLIDGKIGPLRTQNVLLIFIFFTLGGCGHLREKLEYQKDIKALDYLLGNVKVNLNGKLKKKLKKEI